MKINKPQSNLLVYYVLTNRELSEFKNILLDTAESESSYATFIMQILKEVDWDIKRLISIMESGRHGKPAAVSNGLSYFLIKALKESIILADYKMLKEKNQDILAMKKIHLSQRYRLAYIDRHNVSRTLLKYNLDI